MNNKGFHNNTRKSNTKNIKNTIQSDRVKDSEIKIRVNKEQKKVLQDKAKKLDMTLTSYILTPHTKDAAELLQLIHDAVDTWNMLNELFHAMETTPDNQIIGKINSILSAHIQKNNQY